MRFKNILIIAVLLLLLAIASYLIYQPKESLQVGDENLENTNPPVFVWKYEKDDSLNLDGIPNTNVYLEVKYGSGKVETKFIDVSSGGCNDLPETEEDSVPNSTNAQCYSAGLGYQFKITKGEDAYLVQRKTFEEAMPNYNPPVYKYEVVAEVPLY